MASGFLSRSLTGHLRDYYGISIAFPIQSLDHSLFAHLILFIGDQATEFDRDQQGGGCQSAFHRGNSELRC